LSSLIILSVLPKECNAEDAITYLYFNPQISIGDFKIGGNYKIIPTSIGEYITSIYTYAIGVVGIIAAVVMMIGGVMWITAGGAADRIGEAKAWISSSIIGLVLALSSFMILQTINPDLVRIKAITIRGIGKPPVSNNEILNSKEDNECKAKGGRPIGVASPYNYGSADSDCKNIYCKEPTYKSLTPYENGQKYCCICNNTIIPGCVNSYPCNTQSDCDQSCPGTYCKDVDANLSICTEIVY